MRILLINPYYPISETPSPPLGLAYIAAALESAGHEVKILDLVVFPYHQSFIDRILQDFNPAMVGATAVTMTVDNAMQVIRDVKALAPKAVTVMGGPHVTFCAHQSLRDCPELDMVVLGEGDVTIVELAEAIAHAADLSQVRGIAFRSDGAVHVTASRDYLEDIDALPLPARHLLPLGRYRTLGMPISMTTSRGCPFQCIFCVGRKMVGARVRYRDPRRVVDELANLAGLGFHQINVADDLFTASYRHCMAVCREIIRRRLNIRWTAFARVDTVSRDLLAQMRAAGCSALSFGIESGNRTMLKRIKKGITLDQVEQAVRMCVETGITPHASFILGLPGETPETMQDTVAFADALHRRGVQHGFHLLAPFPGTEVYDAIDQFDLKLLSTDWRAFHANRAIVETSAVSRETLDAIVLQWEDKYDQFLAQTDRDRRTGQADAGALQQLENLERIVVLYEWMMADTLLHHGRYPAKVCPGSAGEDHLAFLAERIAADSPHPVKRVRRILAHAYRHGSLNCRLKGDTIHWTWVEELPPQLTAVCTPAGPQCHPDRI
jgi:radical SAM superfamily enzyme YgiQ (UPF0313 family)